VLLIYLNPGEVKMRLPTDEEAKLALGKLWKGSVTTLSNKTTIILMSVLILAGTIFSYSWSYKALAGFYDQTAWAVHGVLTNWTFGFVIFWIGTGACLGILFKKWKIPDFWNPILIGIILFIVAYAFSLIGFEGFRW